QRSAGRCRPYRHATPSRRNGSALRTPLHRRIIHLAQTTEESEALAQQVAPSTGLTPVPDHDFMPLNGIHHVELFVGNALQAAYYFSHAFGFKRVAYRGLETGTRDQVSHVLQ